MNVEVRGESVVITGYVNAVERYSKPITSTWRGSLKTFIERIKAGVFKTALKRNDNVKVLLNHKWDRELANTKDGSAKLEEDNIGLRAEVTITDKEVVEKAKDGKLVGWSFGFYSNADEAGVEGMSETRTVTDLDLAEVSILDDSKRPAYNGTSIEARCEGGVFMEIREEKVETEKEQTERAEETKEIDVEQLAEVVANKVLDKLNAREATAEESGVATEQETETETEGAEEETEKRAIDYSYYEDRMAKL
jgi:HK97 family phage prohead protease